jgi:formylglycine-generating enzyme required for sulfatase activity
MYIWGRLLQDIVRILRHYGAFRDVRVFDLVINSSLSNNDDQVWLEAMPNRRRHRPSELIDQRGHRIVVVLSDCAGAYWWNGTLLPMLEDWGNSMPTAIWQMLPAWMWQRTALGRGTAVAISNDLPGTANQRLQVQTPSRELTAPTSQRLALPVVSVETNDLARWSRMVTGDRRAVMSGFQLPPPGGSVPRSQPYEKIAEARAQQALKESEQTSEATDIQSEYEKALTKLAQERVERFLALSSPEAIRLIMLLAAAPVVTLPVVRLIRDAMLTDVSSPRPIAEVFLSGLIQRLPGQNSDQLAQVLAAAAPEAPQPAAKEDSEPTLASDVQDFVQYDFMPQVRPTLLKFLPAVDAVEVINSVSAAVERRWYRFTPQNFRAFLTDPAVTVREDLAGLRSFASVTADILKQLGSDYAREAQKFAGASDRQTSVRDEPDWLNGFTHQPLTYPVAEYLDFPPLTDFDYTAAELIEEEDTFPPLQPDDFKIVTIELVPTGPPVDSFDFTLATLQQQGVAGDQLPLTTDNGQWIVERQPGQAYRYIETLPEDITLEMVNIPNGTFVMGSPEDEPERNADRESPQHDVTVPGFFMGRYPITQAQWRVVANLPPVNRKLNPDPSRFKGDNRPVERVSWHDAVEFCVRLSAHTDRTYRLPSEAEWEYACRAGTTTPFHFGDMITTDVANYNGSTYADGPQGKSRGETTPVDHFDLANAFGLSDMHGNVWEWCADHWHENYNDAPTDGSAWTEGGDSSRRGYRGGSWYGNPGYCRSASRNWFSPDYRDYYLGFRVVCSPPRPVLSEVEGT